MSLAVVILVSSSRATSHGLNTTKSSPCRNAYNQLYVIKRFFSAFCPPPIKRLLYISLVHSKLSYCSQVWRPMLIKDIVTLERIQHWSTKFITGTPSLSYWERLISLHLLPLMYFYEYLDVILLVQSLQHPDDSFNIHDYITFSSHTNRSSSSLNPHSNTILLIILGIFTLTESLDYGMLSHWSVSLSLSLPTIKVLSNKFLWLHFLEYFESSNPSTYHFISRCSIIVTLVHQPIHNFPARVPCSIHVSPIRFIKVLFFSFFP